MGGGILDSPLASVPQPKQSHTVVCDGLSWDQYPHLKLGNMCARSCKRVYGGAAQGTREQRKLRGEGEGHLESVWAPPQKQRVPILPPPAPPTTQAALNSQPFVLCLLGESKTLPGGLEFTNSESLYLQLCFWKILEA